MRIAIIYTVFFMFFAVLIPDGAADENTTHEAHKHELKIYDKPEIVELLMGLEKKGKHFKVINTIRAIDDGEKMKDAVLWLRERVMADDTPDPRYAFLYAESLLRIIGDEQEENRPLMETAAMVYMYGHLTLSIDVQRCLNREDSWNRIKSLIEPFDQLANYYKTLPENKRRDILAVAMRLEDRLAGRPPNSWVCAAGSSVQKEDIEVSNKNTDDKLERVESEIISIMQELELQPHFVSARIWRERRQNQREAFAKKFR